MVDLWRADDEEKHGPDDSCSFDRVISRLSDDEYEAYLVENAYFLELFPKVMTEYPELPKGMKSYDEIFEQKLVERFG